MNYKKLMTLNNLLILIAVLFLSGLIYSKVLKKESFENNDSAKIKVLLFKMKQCSHCVKFMPEFEKFQKETEKKNLSVDIKIVDSDDEGSSELMKKYNVESFPTVIFVKDEKKHEYQGERTEKALTSYLDNLYE